MTDTVTISCRLGTTDPLASLGFEAWVNNHKFFDLDHVQQAQTICIELNNTDTEHELRFVLKNKNQTHTRVDQAGNIIADANLIITNLTFDGIELGPVFNEQAIYEHDYNGTQETTQTKFYGEMGCNGTVSFKFSTPLYMWLLEHM